MADNSATIFHSNRYNAQAACEHCEGVIRHEPWCITLHPTVHYAYLILANPSKLTVGDALILHSLGVVWGANVCNKNCVTNQTVHTVANGELSNF
jgi:hypothetical protein